MNPPVVTALYAGLNALILMWLAAEVVSRRRSRSVSLGDGGDKELGKVIRAHGNAAETIPIALILLALAELFGAPAVALHIAGVLLTGGRIAHALHFTGRAGMRFRIYGMIATFLVTGLLAAGLIAHAITRMAV